jgi:signal transduction histidine kinase
MPIITGTSQLARYGSYASAIFIILTSYAILTQHLFDIRIFIRRTVIFSSLVAFAFLTYSLIVYLATLLLGSRSQLNTGGPNVYIDLITIIIVGFSYEPIKVWLSEKTDKWLFKKEYEQEVVIKELSQKLNNVIALDEALEVVMHTTAKALHLHHAVTYVFQQADRGEQAIKRIKQIGYATTQRLILEERDFVMNYFCTHAKILFTENLLDELEHEKSLLEGKKFPEAYKSQAEFIRDHAVKAAVAKKLEQLEIAVAMPLVLKDQPLGLILLSSKQSNESFSKQDLTLLELVGDQAISSIQKAKLYEGDQMKSEFVSIASHELLTPISAIEGYLSMILDEKIAGQGLDAQTTDYLSKCFSSAKRLSMLVKDLLSVSRIESGKMKFTAQQLDSTKSIQDTIDQLRFIAQEKQITLKFKQPEPAFPPVLADPDRTSQVLINLVSNAIKYNRAGGDVEVTTELLKKERMVSITVKDNGLGMDKEQMSHLFEKFYRVDTKETMGILGTGLGLYITKSIVERMGGAITVQSTPGKGSAFTFTIPLLEVEKSIAS